MQIFSAAPCMAHYEAELHSVQFSSTLCEYCLLPAPAFLPQVWVKWIGDSTVSLVELTSIKPLAEGIKHRTRSCKKKLPKGLQTSIDQALKLLKKRQRQAKVCIYKTQLRCYKVLFFYFFCGSVWAKYTEIDFGINGIILFVVILWGSWLHNG